MRMVAIQSKLLILSTRTTSLAAMLAAVSTLYYSADDI